MKDLGNFIIILLVFVVFAVFGVNFVHKKVGRDNPFEYATGKKQKEMVNERVNDIQAKKDLLNKIESNMQEENSDEE